MLAAGLLLCGCGTARPSHTASHPAAVSEPVHFLPGGLRTLATQRLGGGERLSMLAERYRFQGRVHLEIDYRLQAPGGGSAGSGVKVEGASPLSWSFGGECPRAGTHARVIVIGLLRAPGDVVLAYAAHRPHRLREVAVPAYLHAGGVAVYAVLGEPPERVLVRTPAGRTVMDEALAHEGPTRCNGQSSLSYLIKKT